MKISIAYSPDTDDQFMVLALREKRVDWQDFEFEFIVDDIQKLNEAALSNVYDITAISIGAYPHLRDNYLLMTVGASIGDEFGPAIVCRPDSPWSIDQLTHKKIAVPGINTSAYVAAQSLFGPFEAVPMNFLEISHAVLNGQVDAGILIHELQLNPETQGLRKISDLGRLWYDRFQLPLPLGANAIHRRLDADKRSRLSAIYKQSIEVGLATRDSSISSAVASAAAKDTLDQTMGDKYISMYVNQRSLGLHSETLAGIRTLFDHGAARGLFASIDIDGHIATH